MREESGFEVLDEHAEPPNKAAAGEAGILGEDGESYLGVGRSFSYQWKGEDFPIREAFLYGFGQLGPDVIFAVPIRNDD